MGNGRLLEHRGGLRALPGGAERLAIGQRSVDILGVGAMAVAVDFDRAARIFRSGRSLRGQRSCYVGHGMAAAEACGESRRQGCGCEIASEAGLSTHATSIHDIGRKDRTERASNRLLTLTSG